MILPPGTHWRLVNSVRKYSSSVSFLRSFPNHNGSPVSRWHTTVGNLSFLLLAFDQFAFLSSLPEKLRLPHFIHRIIGMPQHIKLVVNDLAARNPLAASQLGAKVFIHRLLLALLPKPQRLPSFQIAHHCRKLVLLAPVPFIVSFRWACVTQK